MVCFPVYVLFPLQLISSLIWILILNFNLHYCLMLIGAIVEYVLLIAYNEFEIRQKRFIGPWG